MGRRASGKVLVVLVLLAVASEARAADVRVVSTRADLVSGGDALVELRGLPVAGLRVTAAGRDVTDSFSMRPNGRVQGLVTGLREGRSAIVARNGARGARLAVTSHPRRGPVIAGPQIKPWVCLAECEPATTFRYVYRSTDPVRTNFRDYDPAAPPADVATITTDQDRSVPFIVRIETGVMDRGLYTVAVLADPEQPWSPYAPQPGWNGKVLWPFGGDCKPWHKQDTPIDPTGGLRFNQPAGPAVGADEAIGSIYGNGNAAEALARGFMVATSAHNKLGSQCNTVVSAEAILMLKEHIRETYGPIRYTIGAGSSGGSMQQHQIASGYPGLLDGIQPMASFPDIWGPVQEATDCHLLNRYFQATPGWTPEQRAAVNGALVEGGCIVQFDGPNLGLSAGVQNYAQTWLDPDNAIGCGLPAEQVYDPVARRDGVRCTLPDYMVSVFGRRASDGFANRPYDNVGVQYGLRALESGRISAEQFVDLNERVGGLDIDWNPQPARSAADVDAVRTAYRAGLVSGGRHLAKVPIVDIRGTDNVEIHADFHSYVVRARLDRANGGHRNQVIWTGARPLVGDPTAFNEAFSLVDRWLSRIEADRSDRPRAVKVLRARPDDAVDTCWIEGHRVTDEATCRTLFPYFADPRIVAGAPLADDVLTCRLQPLVRTSHPGAFRDAQWARLQRAFPGGVCDYDRPGVGQRPPAAWVSFASGPGGRPLGRAPRSKALSG